jgi:hypothetical protein
MHTGPAIAIDGLTKRFGRARGVEELSLRVPQGEVPPVGTSAIFRATSASTPA